MNKHTPGPWHMVLSDNATPIVNHENGVDWTDDSDISSRVCAMPAEITTSYSSLANAQLIAVSPELLESLQEVLALAVIKYGNLHPDVNAVFDKAAALIAKAKGQTP